MFTIKAYRKDSTVYETWEAEHYVVDWHASEVTSWDPGRDDVARLFDGETHDRVVIENSAGIVIENRVMRMGPAKAMPGSVGPA